MTNIALLQRLGLFVQNDFLSPQLCEHLLSGMRSAETAPVQVVTVGAMSAVEPRETQTATQATQTVAAPELDPHQRVTEQIQPSASSECLIRERLFAIQPALEQHFSLALNGYQDPLFYRYNPGGFFAAHRDCIDTPDAPDFLRSRRVSIIIFLNEMSKESTPGSYGGGALTFYGLMNDPRYGFPITGTPGMLIAFRSDITHEVQKVTDGERYTVVSWFI
jgi:predicted 2-oxoglutarate/Fe(II)-dependent dioxygenase YbiX